MIDLSTPLSLASSFRFRLQSPESRREIDPAEIYDPLRALRRCIQGGRAYWHAWLIALCALVVSFSGLLALGAGFLFTSVWFWQVAGFSFARVFTRRFGLDADPLGG